MADCAGVSSRIAVGSQDADPAAPRSSLSRWRADRTGCRSVPPRSPREGWRCVPLRLGGCSASRSTRACRRASMRGRRTAASGNQPTGALRGRRRRTTSRASRSARSRSIRTPPTASSREQANSTTTIRMARITAADSCTRVTSAKRGRRSPPPRSTARKSRASSSIPRTRRITCFSPATAASSKRSRAARCGRRCARARRAISCCACCRDRRCS